MKKKDTPKPAIMRRLDDKISKRTSRPALSQRPGFVVQRRRSISAEDVRLHRAHEQWQSKPGECLGRQPGCALAVWLQPDHLLCARLGKEPDRKHLPRRHECAIWVCGDDVSILRTICLRNGFSPGRLAPGRVARKRLLDFWASFGNLKILRREKNETHYR